MLRNLRSVVAQAPGQSKWVGSRRSFSTDAGKPRVSLGARIISAAVAIILGVKVGEGLYEYLVKDGELEKKIKELANEALEKQSKEMKREYSRRF